jgi:hypothetical protein
VVDVQFDLGQVADEVVDHGDLPSRGGRGVRQRPLPIPGEAPFTASERSPMQDERGGPARVRRSASRLHCAVLGANNCRRR